MSIPSRRGPRQLSEILGDLFTVRGYGRLLARQELEDAWNTAVGEPYCWQTQLGDVRHGVLNVTVAHSTLLEELAAFKKPSLLAALRTCAPATPIDDIRFRVGEVTCSGPPRPVAALGPPATAIEDGDRPAPRRGAKPASKRKANRGNGHDPCQA
jgi:predicted nucleic acid-binding Zn ribbon protein